MPVVNPGAGGTVGTDAIWDAKGDLAVATAADTAARLAVGTNYEESLVPDSAVAAGLKWGLRRSVLRPSGAIAETVFGRIAATANSSALLSQRLSLMAIALPNNTVITSITFFSSATSLATGVNQLFGIYDDAAGSSSGTPYALLRGSNDDTSTAWPNFSTKTLNLTSTYTTTRAGFFYLGILVNATTVPTMLGVTLANSLVNLAPILYGTSNTGVTALPNPATAPTSSGVVLVAYVS